MVATGARQSPSNASTKILNAAAVLFVAHGYAATTVEMIAQEAGVAVPTVYFSFRSKVNVLRGLADRDLAPDAPSLAAYRRLADAAQSGAGEPRERLSRHVRACATRNAKVGALAAMLRRAADVDIDAAELWRHDLDQRRSAQRRLVGVLRGEGALAAGVRPQRAIDVLTTLLGPDVYTMLVTDRGWSSAEWQRWAERMLATELFEPRAPAGDRGPGPVAPT